MTASLQNITILIVDDDADTCDLLRTIVEQFGATAVTARSADAAIETFRRNPPHAVVADIRLGMSDGYALIRAIRALNVEYKGFTPAIAITGYASPEDRERALAEGFNEFFTKPFDPVEVVDALKRMLLMPISKAA